MKKLLLGVILSALGIAYAAAADLPTMKPAPAYVPPPAYNWTGFYIGGTLGGVFGNFDPATSTVFSPTGYFAATSVPAIGAVGSRNNQVGFTGGGEIGYNWQLGSFVVGVESDFEFLGLRSKSSGSALYPTLAPAGFTVNSSAHSDWMFTARPRIGYAFNNFLFFVTGGVAVTDPRGVFSFTDTFAHATESGSISNTRVGYTVGGGVEAGLWSNWSIKAEYLFANFGSVSTTSNNLVAFTPATAFPTNTFSHSLKVEANLVRLGVNYRF
jgi:outer membrane immunogenic protein